MNLPDYYLVLESYDIAALSTTLKTDTVTIKIYEYLRSSTITSPVFILKGNSEILVIDQIVQTIGQPITPTFYVRQSIAALVFV